VIARSKKTWLVGGASSSSSNVKVKSAVSFFQKCVSTSSSAQSSSHFRKSAAISSDMDIDMEDELNDDNIISKDNVVVNKLRRSARKRSRSSVTNDDYALDSEEELEQLTSKHQQNIDESSELSEEGAHDSISRAEQLRLQNDYINRNADFEFQQWLEDEIESSDQIQEVIDL
jgi:hypothetical protein